MKRGDLVRVATPGNYGKPRPALVVQADQLTAENCGSGVVCPLTTTLTGTTSFRVVAPPSAQNGLRQPSAVSVSRATSRQATGQA